MVPEEEPGHHQMKLTGHVLMAGTAATSPGWSEGTGCSWAGDLPARATPRLRSQPFEKKNTLVFSTLTFGLLAPFLTTPLDLLS